MNSISSSDCQVSGAPLESGLIKRLPPAVAERIAAGEVIERPASVVKELLENSLDAGATEVSIRLEDGGKSLIEVMDNGKGMGPADLALCIERHATSKLSSLEDLDRIATLGFRGEALPSVAAVSEVSIISRTATGDSAYELIAGDVADRGISPPAPKRITFGHFNHSPHGTRIQARGLFSQVPARLKFLKSQAAEVAQVREWVERVALAYPHVGFQVFSGDRRLLQLRPQSELERVREILGEGEDYPVIFGENEQDGLRDRGLRLRAYWLQGLSSPQNRRLVQIVNSRSLRDKFLQQALMSPFRQSLLPGQFPAVALFVEVNPAAIDVNVHPTKAEVRFLEKSKVFTSIDSLVRNMIAQHGAPARVPLSFDRPQFESQMPKFSTESRETEPKESRPHTDRADPGAAPTFSRASFHPAVSIPPSETWSLRELSLSSNTEDDSFAFNPEPTSTPQMQPEILGKSLALEFPPSPVPQGLDRTPSTILFQTYLVYEDGSELVLIDQHAAHERIRYEKLKQRLRNNTDAAPKTSQALLMPETIKLREGQTSLIPSLMPVLEKMGFEAELFGEETLLFRSIPTEWGQKNLKVRLKNLMEKLLEFSAPIENLLVDETLFESLASEACHSAVRAGDSLTLTEAHQLTRDLFLCEHPWNCPHGRPTVVRIPMRKLEEWFQRKV